MHFALLQSQRPLLGLVLPDLFGRHVWPLLLRIRRDLSLVAGVSRIGRDRKVGTLEHEKGNVYSYTSPIFQ